MSASGSVDGYDVRAVQLTQPSQNEDDIVQPTYVWLANQQDQPSGKFYGLVIPKVIPGATSNKIYNPGTKNEFFTRNWLASDEEEALSIIEPDHEEGSFKYALRDDQDSSGDGARRELLIDLRAVRSMDIVNMPGLNRAVKQAVNLKLS